MKVLHVTQNYYPSHGGTQYAIKKISELFAERYHDDVNVYTSNSMFGPNRAKFEKISVKAETINGVKVRRFSFLRIHIKIIILFGRFLRKCFDRPLPDFLVALMSGPVSFSMMRAVNSAEVDVIGSSSIHYLFADYPAWRKYTAKPKPFVMFGALHLHGHDLLALYKKRIQAADYYIANTNYEKKQLLELGFEESKITVIGVGSDILDKADFKVSDSALISAYHVETGSVVITYIGRHEVFKGIPILLSAYDKISAANPNVLLFICGAASLYTEELKKISSSNKSIRLFTNITELQKTELLRLTDILVLPSKEESFGIVFLEAWSFSKPVIGANIGAIASLIEDGTDGLLFEPDDSESLAEKLILLINSEQLRNELGNNGHKKYSEQYTWAVVAKKFRDVYQSAITKFNQQEKHG